MITIEKVLLEVKSLEVETRGSNGAFERRVNGVSFSLSEGETLALVGQRGCGKSAAVRVVNRLYSDPRMRVAGGEIWFRGQELLRMSAREYRHKVGPRIACLFSEIDQAFNPLLRVREHFRETLRYARLEEPVTEADIIDCLYEMGIYEPEACLHRYPWELGLGSRQRMVLAMAVLAGAELLIADEASAQLDATAENQLMELLSKLRSERGLSILLTTHNLGVVEELADRMAVLYKGRMVESGPSDEVLNRPRSPYTEALTRSIPKLGERRSRLDPLDQSALAAVRDRDANA